MNEDIWFTPTNVEKNDLVQMSFEEAVDRIGMLSNGGWNRQKSISLTLDPAKILFNDNYFLFDLYWSETFEDNSNRNDDMLCGYLINRWNKIVIGANSVDDPGGPRLSKP